MPFYGDQYTEVEIVSFLSSGRGTSERRSHSAKIVIMCITLALTCALLVGCGGEDSISGTVSVLGNTLTDMTREELGDAVEKIAEQNPITGSIEISFLGQKYDMELEDIAVRYDVDAISDAAFEAGDLSLWGRLFGSDEVAEIPLSITYDSARLEAQAGIAASSLSRDATDFSYEINENDVTVTKGGAAASLDKDVLVEALTKKLDEKDFTLLEIDADYAHADINFEALKEEIDRPVQNPKLDLEADPKGGVILPAERGIEMDIETARKAFEESGDEPTFTFPVTFTEPTMSMEDFQSHLFRDTLSTVTSSFNPGLKGRTTNVKLACDFCNDVILNPGDEFSYNKTVGPRTYERGFKDATVYVAGTTEEGVGGGICQVSSTIYSAALHADLKISERYNHSYMITYVPLGEDATVVYGSKDFKFVNDTDYPIKLRVTYGKSTMTVSIIGTNLTNKKVEISTKRLSSTPFKTVYQTDTSLAPDTKKVKNNGYTGYVTESYRLVYENGELVSNTFENKSVYKKLDKLILENPSKPENSGAYVPPVTGPADVPVEPKPDPGQTTTPDPDPGQTTEPQPDPQPDPGTDPVTTPDEGSGGDVPSPDNGDVIDGGETQPAE